MLYVGMSDVSPLVSVLFHKSYLTARNSSTIIITYVSSLNVFSVSTQDATSVYFMKNQYLASFAADHCFLLIALSLSSLIQSMKD